MSKYCFPRKSFDFQFVGKKKLWLAYAVRIILKVSKFQNEFLKSSFLPKYERKNVRISALCGEGITYLSEGRYLEFFVRILRETMT